MSELSEVLDERPCAYVTMGKAMETAPEVLHEVDKIELVDDIKIRFGFGNFVVFPRKYIQKYKKEFVKLNDFLGAMLQDIDKEEGNETD